MRRALVGYENFLVQYPYNFFVVLGRHVSGLCQYEKDRKWQKPFQFQSQTQRNQPSSQQHWQPPYSGLAKKQHTYQPELAEWNFGVVRAGSVDSSPASMRARPGEPSTV